jgi:iron complex transport system substrate-binding protein
MDGESDSRDVTGRSELRIASMLASGTEILAALGLEEQLVAISHECDYPAHILDRPRVSRPRFDPSGLSSGEIDQAVRQAMLEHGSVYEVDADALARLRPHLILTQAVCEVCAVPAPGVREIVQRRDLGAEVLSLDAHTLDDVFESVMMVGSVAGSAERAAHVVAEYRARVSRVQRAVAGCRRPRALALEWLNPPFVPGHWVPEMIAIAGAENLAGETAQRSAEVSWDAVTGLDPDVLLIMPCGFGLEASIADANQHAAELRRVATRAVATGQAWVVDGSSYFNRSGPRVVDGIEILGRIFHPDALGEPDPSVATRWVPANGLV